MTKRKKRQKADKSLADTGARHPKLLVVQKKSVVNITTDREYEMRADQKALDAHLAKNQILEDAYFKKKFKRTDKEIKKERMDPDEIHKIYKKNRAWKLQEDMQRP